MSRFDYFVILAGMRTGSNRLEEVLSTAKGLTCHGEVFNPHFVGGPKRDSLFGIGLGERDTDPLRLLARIASEPGTLGGFRLFQDHDARVIAEVLANPRCAKIVLTRNPVDSYVSLKIAQATGQWWLGDAKSAKTARARFEEEDFNAFLTARRDFYLRINRALQTSGQTAFYIDYADMSDAAVVNGLVRHLGLDATLATTKVRAKVQNPQSLEEKVENYAEMAQALAGVDYFDLSRIPNFEPERGPGVPGFVISQALNLLFMPLRGGPTEAVSAWLRRADGGELRTGLNRRQIQHWKRQTPGHRSFTVVSHPLARAHAVFCKRILSVGDGAYEDIRSVLRARYDVPLPEAAPGKEWSDAAHRTAFLAFLGFLKANLGGQTAVRMDAEWASQAGLLHHLAEVMVPDRVLRADRLSTDLPTLGEATFVPEPDQILNRIYDRDLEVAARAAYARDYMMFGFEALRPAD
ncbi:MAG: nodulation protein NodH [Pseudomonadota bacterium]